MKKRGSGQPKNSNQDIDTILLKEQDQFRRLKQILSYFEKRYKISSQDILEATSKEPVIPVSIFTKRLTVLETIVKFLKEEYNYSYHQIAVLLNRNERNIWHAYDNAIKKRKEKLKVDSSEYLIPLSIFQNKGLSILESLVVYLKEEFNLSYHKIAVLLKRDDRTIWTVYHKAKKKK